MGSSTIPGASAPIHWDSSTSATKKTTGSRSLCPSLAHLNLWSFFVHCPSHKGEQGWASFFCPGFPKRRHFCGQVRLDGQQARAAWAPALHRRQQHKPCHRVRLKQPQTSGKDHRFLSSLYFLDSDLWCERQSVDHVWIGRHRGGTIQVPQVQI